MDPDEIKLSKYLETRGLRTERFSKEETRKGKTPDFRVFEKTALSFYCEVKSSPKDGWLDEQLEIVPAGCVAGGGRNDPIFNRLTDDIHKAIKQFDAVNPSQVTPNVLALVNHDDMCAFNDLLGVVTGNFYAEDGSVHPIYRQFSEGRIKDEKHKIHLYVWLDDHKPDRLFFTQTDSNHHETLCKLFGIDSKTIRQVGP